jgi:hypothetical protein
VTANHAICDAIRHRHLLAFDYQERPRVVAPYCHGWSARGVELLRAIQVGGESRSGGFGFGKLWHVLQMQNIRVTTEAFEPDDPDYEPEDGAMARVHCRVWLPRVLTT